MRRKERLPFRQGIDLNWREGSPEQYGIWIRTYRICIRNGSGNKQSKIVLQKGEKISVWRAWTHLYGFKKTYNGFWSKNFPVVIFVNTLSQKKLQNWIQIQQQPAFRSAFNKIPGSGFSEYESVTQSPECYLLDEPVETGEHVENGREVPVDVLMLVQTVELRLHQQDVLREPELQQEVVVHLFKKKR